MFLDGKEDLTAFADFPPRHWKKIQFTNRLERINREIKRRTDVVQAFPNQLREQQLQGETGPLTVAGSSCAASPHEPPSQDCCGGDQTGEMSGPCDVKAARCRG
jgi:hypothetical protein